VCWGTLMSRIQYSRYSCSNTLVQQWLRWHIAHIFVANVNFNDDGSLGVSVRRFEGDGVWCGSRRHRFVIPETYCFSYYLVGVFFSSPFFHPPIIFPSSSSNPDSSVYFLSGIHLFSQQIWAKNLIPSSLLVATSNLFPFCSTGR
jgi:hypothetical protein